MSDLTIPDIQRLLESRGEAEANKELTLAFATLRSWLTSNSATGLSDIIVNITRPMPASHVLNTLEDACKKHVVTAFQTRTITDFLNENNPR